MGPPTDAERINQVAGLFDAVAPVYDQVGVEFFGPIAEHLVRLLTPSPGESVIELGCGRGALTLPLAAAVGPTGSVRTCDVSPAMVAEAREATHDLPQVTVEFMNAAEPTYARGSCDLVASSCVIFFLPDPAAALRRWVALLAPGGRLGLTTFGPQDEVWSEVDALFDPYLPTASLEVLVLASGAASVGTETQPVTVRFADVTAWRRWTMSVGQRMMWGFVPEDERDRLVERAAELLEPARDADGMIALTQAVRHTVGRVA